MSIKNLKTEAINPAISYALGMIYPLFKVKNILGYDYAIGSVNHNPGKVTQDELNEHYVKVYELIKEYEAKHLFEIKTNKSNTYTISPKLGFSVIIKTDGLTESEVLEILTQKVNEVKESNNDNKKAFVRGCFDGRSSWDTTAHYLSIDVDREYDRQDLIVGIIEDLGVGININRRDVSHAKNDQIRIKQDSINKFMSTVGLYSICREKIVLNGMRHL